jgi:rubredoxin
MLPREDTELVDNAVHVSTSRIPFFAQHKLVLRVNDDAIDYKLGVPSMWPLILFLYLAVLFLAGLTNWKMMVVGALIVTGIAFAIYVLNDKGARNYVHKHTGDLVADNDLPKPPDSADKCPACGAPISQYTQECNTCGLVFKGNKTPNKPETHTGSKDTQIHYHISK